MKVSQVSAKPSQGWRIWCCGEVSINLSLPLSGRDQRMVLHHKQVSFSRWKAFSNTMNHPGFLAVTKVNSPYPPPTTPPLPHPFTTGMWKQHLWSWAPMTADRSIISLQPQREVLQGHMATKSQTWTLRIETGTLSDNYSDPQLFRIFHYAQTFLSH